MRVLQSEDSDWAEWMSFGVYSGSSGMGASDDRRSPSFSKFSLT